ncbi:D-alanyl-D-alanine carboxypeptidase family protein [uncultured Slackia sp.]|uniref:D-alanyl-D-alanine carboxypeptidase family protein n=1 Tax=uncultured Slackia sp. TaxID=665903 RepID=UPI0026DEE01E|nr:serine hydrolase [uncultured Slackia sp.]
MSARVGATFVSCALAASLCCIPVQDAFGVVLQEDEVLSQSVADRGLSVASCPDIEARNALLVSQDGTVYFARDAHEPVKIASITKVMTAVVALENASLDTQVVVDAEAAGVGESSAGLLEGDAMDLETALYALMVPSGNDAAIAVAKTVGALLPEYDGSDPQAAFVAAMNAKAHELGCEDTVYTNPHGLDAGAFESDCHSTAADVGLVVSYAMRNDTFRAIVDAGDTTIEVASADGARRFLQLVSTDELIGVYDGICGVKTGTTDAAGFCFAGAASREEGEFYSVVLGSPDSDVRFTDTVALFDWMYGNIVQKRLINSTEYIEAGGVRQPLVAKVAHTQWPDCTIDAVASDPELAVEVFDLVGPIEQQASFVDVRGDVSEGDVIGHLTFTQNGEKIAECDLVAAESQAAPDFFQEIGVWIDRFVRGLQNQPETASSVCLNDPSAISDM